ncbi:MAG: hypothetical protein HOP23_01225 [Methylococcaceae bacterium]|nr:hypothetical protein [Methylococcaceae bacterium]
MDHQEELEIKRGLLSFSRNNAINISFRQLAESKKKSKSMRFFVALYNVFGIDKALQHQLWCGFILLFLHRAVLVRDAD